MFATKFLALPFVIIMVWAQQNSPIDDNWPDIESVRQAITLKWFPEGQNIKIFITGYETINVEFDDLNIEATYGFGKNKKMLAISRGERSFTINNKAGVKDLNLKLKVREKEAQTYNLNLRKN